MSTTNTPSPINQPIQGGEPGDDCSINSCDWNAPLQSLSANETPEKPLTVAQITAKDFRKTAVFQKFGIDFCCGGGQTLEEASRKAGIPESELRSALQLADFNPLDHEKDFAHWDMTKLADYIIHTHHGYVRENAPVLLQFARKVAGHHGKDHPELIQLEEGVRLAMVELSAHMEKEEKVLFPAICQLDALDMSSASAKTQLQFIRQAIQKMQSEHVASGEDLRQFRVITNNYTLPAAACNSYKFLFEKLKEFEYDLHNHIHLENNILFPRALAESPQGQSNP
jgi:regulator of cell morphogenesis and NO signaling